MKIESRLRPRASIASCTNFQKPFAAADQKSPYPQIFRPFPNIAKRCGALKLPADRPSLTRARVAILRALDDAALVLAGGEPVAPVEQHDRLARTLERSPCGVARKSMRASSTHGVEIRKIGSCP